MIISPNGDLVDDFSDLKAPEVPALPAITLNDDQQKAFDWLVPFCEGRRPERRALLAGFAGTGKTTLVNIVIEAILGHGRQVAMTAPTHKAVRILRKYSRFKDRMVFATIHSLLGLKEKVHEDGRRTFEAEFTKDGIRKISRINLLIVDETSQLPDLLFDHITKEQVRNPDLLVLYVGDPMQIPPVREQEARKIIGYRDAMPFLPEWQAKLEIPVLTLSTPQRQAAESPIIMYAHTIREHIDKFIIPYELPPLNGQPAQPLASVPRKGVGAIVDRLFLSTDFADDPDYAKIVAWRRNTVRDFNQWIRNRLQGAAPSEALPYILQNDLLVMDQALVNEEGNVWIANNEELKVNSASLVKAELRYTKGYNMGGDPLRDTFRYECYQCDVVTGDDEARKVQILHENYHPAFAAIREEIRMATFYAPDPKKKQQLWQQYWELPNRFAWVSYNYALTAHKAQGSTYTNCFSMEWDIQENWNVDEMNRIRYVAATRPNTRLFIVR